MDGTDELDERIERSVGDGKQYWLVFLKKGARHNAPDQPADLQQMHLRHMFRLREAGHLLLNGPLLHDGDPRGIGIFAAESREQVARWCDGDPAVQSQQLTYDIYEWFGMPGDRLV